MKLTKLERWVAYFSVGIFVVISALKPAIAFYSYMSQKGHDVNGTIADWVSALGSLLAVIVACIAARWAKRASDRTEEISKRSVDVEEFSVANDILKKLCEDTLNCYKETRLEDVSYEFRERSIIDFIKSVKNIYSSFDIMDLEQKNFRKCQNAIRAYLGENIYNVVTKKEYEAILKHHMIGVGWHTFFLSMMKINKQHDIAAGILRKYDWNV